MVSGGVVPGSTSTVPRNAVSSCGVADSWPMSAAINSMSSPGAGSRDASPAPTPVCAVSTSGFAPCATDGWRASAISRRACLSLASRASPIGGTAAEANVQSERDASATKAMQKFEGRISGRREPPLLL